MSRIYINNIVNKKVIIEKEPETEKYKRICEETNKRIKEAHDREGKALIKARKFIAR